MIWSCLYGFAAYFLGSAILSLSAPGDVALGVLGAIVVVGFLVVLRRNYTRLEAETERRLPG